ncbi:hypothetical protein MOA67_gp197 [Klebsiella phage KpLz-2_45]|uniref:hypothetical protein n=1 Tax=Klebsiella phage KpLz-2_45 TaxID=2698923 RepID=UPI001F138791|nr:hypothetical protein MOA67_gp197 [Klebsiella phage KpLz-2_45]UKS72063.1 hypothetical protein KpLz245_1970 [Klebsiella phage KpLz-2_45]
MNTVLTEDQVKKHVELAAKRFLSENVTACNFYYTNMYDFKFQSTSAPTPGEKTPWENFLYHLNLIGVKGFSYCFDRNELYFISPIISEAPSHRVNTTAIVTIRELFTEPYLRNCAASHFDIAEQQRLFYKEFCPQRYASATEFAHALGERFDTLTYFEALKAASLYRDLGITSIEYSG